MDLSLIFYDLTSSYFEGNGCPLATWGYSRDHRPDCKQIQIGLVVNKGGIPLTHEVFEGNIKDQTTLDNTLQELKTRFNITQCIFVADDGIICNSTFGELDKVCYNYISTLRLHRSKEAMNLIDKLPPIKEFRKDNMYVKELSSDNEFNYVAVYNPKRENKTRLSREERIAQSESFLKEYTKKPAKHKMRKPDKLLLQIVRYLRKNKTYKFFHIEHVEEGKFRYTKRPETIQQEQGLDGLQILKTNAKELSVTEIALGYRTLHKVENAFNEIKNFLKIRPIRHFADPESRGMFSFA
jgi:transposase